MTEFKHGDKVRVAHPEGIDIECTVGQGGLAYLPGSRDGLYLQHATSYGYTVELIEEAWPVGLYVGKLDNGEPDLSAVWRLEPGRNPGGTPYWVPLQYYLTPEAAYGDNWRDRIVRLTPEGG